VFRKTFLTARTPPQGRVSLPPLKAWLLSLQSFAAAALALYIALSLNLPRPYWAVTSVYITTQPFAGATRAKGLWRLAGTFAGGAFTVATLPNLVNAPPLLCLTFALWVALCLVFSLLDPTPRSYAFMLAGYTSAVIGFPSVDAPAAIFDTAVSRCEEISLGILSAWLVHGVLLPRPGVPILRQRLTAWMGDVARFGAASLQTHLDDEAFVSERRRIARDGAALTALFHGARYELSGKAALLWLPALHEHARRVPALITFIADRAEAIRAEDSGAHAAMLPLLGDTARWLGDTVSPRSAHTDLAARLLLARIAAAGDAAQSRASWAGVLQEGLATRLTELVESWRECISLGARMLPQEPADAPPPAEGIRSPGHTDPLLLALSGTATALAILIGCAFWIGTGWAHGASVPMMAAVVTCVFAQLDDPAPALAKWITGAALSLVAAGLLLFAVLPVIDGFPLLLLVLAVLYLPVGAFQAIPAYSAASLAIAVTTPSVMSLQETYNAEFASFADGAAATMTGLTLALIVIRLIRSFGVALRVQRLVEADRRDLLRLVEGQPGELRRILAVMLDRFEALAARLVAVDARTIGVAELADLRTSLNLLRLRELSASLTPGMRQLIAATLAALRAELRGRGSPADTLATLDTALTTAMDAPDRTARDAALSLAGLRLARFPNALPPPPQDGAIRSLAA
jgi:uncharacterized membrane protein YccC